MDSGMRKILRHTHNVSDETPQDEFFMQLWKCSTSVVAPLTLLLITGGPWERIGVRQL